MARSLKTSLLLLGFLLSPALTFAQDKIESAPEAETTIISIGSDQSYDPSTIALRYAESTARRFGSALGGTPNSTNTSILTNATLSDVERAFSAISSKAAKTVLIVYVSGLFDDEGIHLRDQRLSHKRLGQLLRSALAEQKFVVMDRMIIGNAQPGKYSFRTGVYPREDANGNPIHYLVADADQLSAYESHSIRSLNVSDILVAGIRGRADRNKDGSVSWSEVIAYTEATLKYSLRPKSPGRLFLDHSGESVGTSMSRPDSRDTPNIDKRVLKHEDSPITESKPEPTTWPWMAQFDPHVGVGRHKGYRVSEDAGLSLTFDATAYRKELLSGVWNVAVEAQKHSHAVSTADANGTAEYSAFSGKVRGQYQFSWEWQDLRPQLGIGQTVAKQTLATSGELGTIKSQTWAPLLEYGIATHFFNRNTAFHGGFFMRNETMYTVYDGEAQRFKSSYVGLEFGYGGGQQ